MKFIHSSDWHIGRLFQNSSLLNDQLHVLQQLKSYLKEHDVDALLISGDIFDRSVPPADAVEALDLFLDEILTELNIPIIMISGNHDSGKRLGFGAKHMHDAGLHILTELSTITSPIIIDSASGPVHVYGMPYHDPVQVREAYNCDVKTYDEAHTFLVDLIKSVRVEGVPSVLMSHCFIDGAEESESERPLSIGGLDKVSFTSLVDFDYVALGHLHAPQYKGAEHIRYSGSLLKYSFSEHQQKKAVTLVEMAPSGAISLQQLALIPRHDLRVLEGTLAEIIEQAQDDDHPNDYIFARLTDTHDLLDPMGQLRQVYPNILQLERTLFSAENGERLVADISAKRSEQQVFEDFFEQVLGQTMSDEQQTLLLETISEARTLVEGHE